MNDADGLLRDGFLRLLGRGADMMRADEVAQVENGVIEIGYGLRQLGIEDGYPVISLAGVPAKLVKCRSSSVNLCSLE